MTTRLHRALLLGTALLAVTACSTAAPNPQFADAQGRLTAAYNDKEVAERGQGDLSNAKMALQSAQTAWAQNDKKTSDHHLMMAQTYMDLAETRGQQAKVELASAGMANRVRLDSKDQQLDAKTQELAARDQQLAGRTEELADSNMALTKAQDRLRDLDMRETSMGSTMVLQDVGFESGQSVLMPGGANRLTPLIDYLRLSPKTRVRIEGYTDDVGGGAYNQRLSQARAEAVKTALVAGSIDAGRIETAGFGLDKPVATNSTASGRQSNRRVEITLLKQPGT